MAPSAVGPELVLSDTQKLKEKSIAADTKYQTIPAPFPDLLRYGQDLTPQASTETCI